MLKEKTYENGDIVTVYLQTGQEILGKLDSEDDNYIVIICVAISLCLLCCILSSILMVKKKKRNTEFEENN